MWVSRYSRDRTERLELLRTLPLSHYLPKQQLGTTSKHYFAQCFCTSNNL
jgi:hypothetical protein